MEQRSRADRLGRVRGKRRRVVVAAASAGLVIVVVGLGVWLAARGASEAVPARKVGVESSVESSGATLNSVVASSSVPIEVPALVGVQLSEAELLLRAAGLDPVRKPTPAGDAPAGVVLEQRPSAGERVPPGSSIELVYADAAAVAAAPSRTGLVVCIDPGHQDKANTGLEPVGPGSTERKAKVTGGAVGVVTRQPESAVVLALSNRIAERLRAYGVTVVMTRATGNVDISNSQRAAVANQAGADLFLRIHADSNTNADIHGISTLYPAGNEWVQPITAESEEAAKMIQTQVIASTGATDRGVVARSDLAGFNYATVPSVLVETGFLSNPVDDKELASEEYQNQLADGIVRGVLQYLGVTD